jgi:hypothetical protein
MTPRLLLLTVAVFAAAPAWADTLRCGSRLVVEGDSAESVIQKCGEPVSIEKQDLVRGPYTWDDNRYRYVAPGSPIEYRVEHWTFNFGPKRFMARVRLEAGVVKEVKTLGYGYR